MIDMGILESRRKGYRRGYLVASRFSFSWMNLGGTLKAYLSSYRQYVCFNPRTGIDISLRNYLLGIVHGISKRRNRVTGLKRKCGEKGSMQSTLYARQDMATVP